ncbi:winged helix-turn-helix transcriptional regulator [Phenylobacterium sp.]|uniref:winged helix-turn-helix transcriptional regulator n=1 Tax=Phenylobacterium sp. TaxID=1871053 RepID=UPI00374D02B6
MTRPSIAPSDALAINAVLVSSRQAVDAICDRWTLALVLAMLQGERRFNGLMGRTGIATRLLSARLRALEAAGIVVRMPYSMHPLRHEYHLTNMGSDLADVLLQMLRWEQNWRSAGEAASRVVHLNCGEPLHPELRCAACGAPVGARDIELKLSRAQLQHMPEKQSVHRRSTVTSRDRPFSPQMLGASLDIFGDKWGIEILLCAFFRIRRFNDFRLCTGISANILTDRLERLVASGILAANNDAAGQAGYWLTTKGVDIYGVVVAVEKWADTWLRSRYRSPVRLIHRACGHEFRSLTTCANCEKAADRSNVGFGTP